MAHFAELNENNIVLRVLVVDNAVVLDENDDEQEQLGISFLKNIFGFDTEWKQTSYNNNFRYRFANPGDTYDETLDAFIRSKPHNSWVFNSTTTDWDPPIPKPSLSENQIADGYFYEWNEVNYQSDNTTGWVLNSIFSSS